MKLKFTDATGHELREITIPAAAVKAGINSACWDLRVQPIPARELAGARSARGAEGAGGAQASSAPAGDPFGFGCGTTGGGGGGGGGFFFGGPNPGPYVLAGSYNVALVVDGKTADTKPLRVAGDPDVVLTDAQRKQLFDMAIEMHELQKRTTDAAAGLASLNRQIALLSTDMTGNTDIPADAKARSR